MLEEAIYNALTGDTTVQGKLDAGSGRYHVYPLRVPDGVNITQAITYTEIDQSLTYPLVRTSLFQLSCIADSFAKARALADDVDRIFNDLSETSLGGAFAVKYVKFQGRSVTYDNDAELYLYPVELFIKY